MNFSPSRSHEQAHVYGLVEGPSCLLKAVLGVGLMQKAGVTCRERERKKEREEERRERERERKRERKKERKRKKVL